MPYKDILFLIVGVAFFARGARMDRESPWLWGGLSLLAWFLAFAGGGGGVRWLVGQLVVYGLMFAKNLWADRKRMVREEP